MDESTKDLLKYGVGAIVVYYVGKQLLVKLGLIKSEEEQQLETQSDTAVVSSITNALATQSPTKTDGEWSQIADIIYEDLKYTAVSDNKSDAGYQLARVKNDADVWTLIKFFGKRQEYTFGIPLGEKKNLQTFVSTNISQDNIGKINDNYSRKNIKFRW